MGAGFSVVLGDLSSMAASFADASLSYERLRPEVTPPTPATGDGTLDEQLAGLMSRLDVLHTRMSEAIDEHGKRLVAARDAFARHDIDVRFMFDDMMPETP